MFLKYIKALATATLLVAAALTAFNLYPYNTYAYFAGAVLWCWVSVIWKDKSLIAVNAVSAIVFVIGWIR